MHLTARALRSSVSVVSLAVAAALLATSAQSATTVGPAPALGDVSTQVPQTVMAVSIDGLRSSAIRKLGPARTPTLHRLIAEGASTLNGRTAREQTDTLPNHTSMVTSRRINAARGGHGVTWNDDRLQPATVTESAGEDVDSVFTAVHAAGGTTALFASKAKFGLFERSWDEAVDVFKVDTHNGRLVLRAVADLREHDRDLRFVHLSRPDVVGHRSGFRSAAYLAAVERADTLLGELVAAIEEHGRADETVLVVTSDHGGAGGSHRDPTKLANFRVPFLAWGAGVAVGADLYDLNPDYANPGRRRTGYLTEPPPVRNGALANLVTDLLGVGPVPGSEINADQGLDVGSQEQ